MAKNVSFTFRQALFSQQSVEVPVVLVTITHPDMGVEGPIRLSSDPTVPLTEDQRVWGTVSEGENYYFVNMGASLPGDSEGTPPSTSLVFANIDQGLVDLLRSIVTPAQVTLTLVLASTPDVIEERYTRMEVTAGSYTSDQISLTIERQSFTTEPWPADRMSKSRFPSLFA